MNEVTVYVPPEVAGALSVAKKHAAKAKKYKYERWRKRVHHERGTGVAWDRGRRAEAKAQRLINKAAKMLRGREVCVVSP